MDLHVLYERYLLSTFYTCIPMCSSPLLEPPNSPGTLLRGCQPLLLLRRDLSHVLLVDLTAPATRLTVDGVLPQAVAKKAKVWRKNKDFRYVK